MFKESVCNTSLNIALLRLLLYLPADNKLTSFKLRDIVYITMAKVGHMHITNSRT